VRACAELNFENFPVDNQDLKIIARCNGSVLRSLRLPGCDGITPLGVSALCNGATCLTRLDLTRIPTITDKALRSVARHLKKLEALHLSHTSKASDRGVMFVLERCLRLRELVLSNMPFITNKTCVSRWRVLAFFCLLLAIRMACALNECHLPMDQAGRHH